MGVPRSLLAILGVAMLVAWIGFVIFLWPVLAANYRGLPYSQARIASIVALMVWFAMFAVTLIAMHAWLTRRPQNPAESASEPLPVHARRALLTTVVGASLVYPIYRLLARMYDDATFTYDGHAYSGPGIQPVTPTKSFYSVTKNVVDPDVNKGLWRLEIAGHVDHPHTWSFDDLAAFEQVDQQTTLMCISNKLGAGLFSNADWRGVRMRDVLEASGVKDGAFEVFIRGPMGIGIRLRSIKRLRRRRYLSNRSMAIPSHARTGFRCG